MAVLALVSLLLDQGTKVLAVARLSPGEVIPLVGELLQLRLIRNSGAAFSMGTGATWVLTVVAVVIVAVVLRFARRLGSRGWALALGLLLGGALGNLTDRMVREPGVGRGHVVDFIAYGSLFIGNVADIVIVCAAVLIALLSVRGIGLDGSRVVPVRPAGDEQAVNHQAEPQAVDHQADHPAEPHADHPADHPAEPHADHPAEPHDRDDPEHADEHHRRRAQRAEEPAGE